MPYPDWVMKHKPKGFYVNKVNDETYRLYRGHSERIPGTKKVRRIVDEYIGTISKTKGLVKTQPKVKGPVQVLRYGCSCILYQIFYRYIEHMRQKFGEQGEEGFVWGLLLKQYGEDGVYWYQHDWLSQRFPGLRFENTELLEEARRMPLMLEDNLQVHFGDDAARVMRIAGNIYRVYVNGRWITSEISPEAAEAARTYGITWEV